MLDLDAIEKHTEVLMSGYAIHGGPHVESVVFLANSAPTLLALARAGRRLAEVVGRAGNDLSGEVMGRYDEEYMDALAAWREADGG